MWLWLKPSRSHWSVRVPAVRAGRGERVRGDARRYRRGGLQQGTGLNQWSRGYCLAMQ